MGACAYPSACRIIRKVETFWKDILDAITFVSYRDAASKESVFVRLVKIDQGIPVRIIHQSFRENGQMLEFIFFKEPESVDEVISISFSLSPISSTAELIWERTSAWASMLLILPSRYSLSFMKNVLSSFGSCILVTALAVKVMKETKTAANNLFLFALMVYKINTMW